MRWTASMQRWSWWNPAWGNNRPRRKTGEEPRKGSSPVFFLRRRERGSILVVQGRGLGAVPLRRIAGEPVGGDALVLTVRLEEDGRSREESILSGNSIS